MDTRGGQYYYVLEAALVLVIHVNSKKAKLKFYDKGKTS